MRMFVQDDSESTTTAFDFYHVNSSRRERKDYGKLSIRHIEQQALSQSTTYPRASRIRFRGISQWRRRTPT